MTSTSLATALGSFQQYLKHKAPSPWWFWSLQITTIMASVFAFFMGAGSLSAALYLQLSWGPNAILVKLRAVDQRIDQAVGAMSYDVYLAFTNRIAMVQDGVELGLIIMGLLLILGSVLLVLLARSRQRSFALLEEARGFASAVGQELEHQAAALPLTVKPDTSVAGNKGVFSPIGEITQGIPK